MRGKVGVIGPTARVCGITPAYAGKSKRIAPSSVLFGDHPRVCGEKLCAPPSLPKGRGSPPRMRGKVYFSRQFFSGHGITPAYAGKSRRQRQKLDLCRDHPRVCGEKLLCVLDTMHLQGSPPRMRGKEEDKMGCSRPLRITPAYAGKSIMPGTWLSSYGITPAYAGKSILLFVPTLR